MSTVPDYHPLALQRRLVSQAAQALKDQRLAPQEHLDLLNLASAQPTSTLQPGRLAEANNPMACPDSLVMTAPNGTAYLSTSLYGLERFDSRHALTQALVKRETLLDASGAGLAFIRLEGPLFQAQSRAILDQRHAALQQLAAQLLTLPTLDDALRVMFLQKLGTGEAAALGDPNSLYLHLTLDGKVTCVYTLPQALRDHYCRVPLPPGETRTWLSPDGLALPDDTAAVYERALVTASDDLQDTFKTLLADYWADTSRSPNVAQVLAYGFALHLQRQYHAGQLEQQQVDWLATVMQPTDYPSAPRMNRLRIVDSHHGALEITGLCVLQPSAQAYPYLYSPTDGLSAFNQLSTLKDHLLNEPGRATLASGLTANDRVTLLSMDAPKVMLKPINAPLFKDLADSLIALQARQLKQALSPPRHWQVSAPLAVDDALDIRARLDPRLLNLPGAGRWLDAQPHWPEEPPLSDPHWAYEDWAQRTHALAQQRGTLTLRQPTLKACARQVLDSWLAVMTWPCLKSDTLMLRWLQAPTADPDGDDDQDTGAPLHRAAALPQLLLGRVTGHTPMNAERLQARLFIVDGQSPPRPERQLPAELVDHLLELGGNALQSAYTQALRDYLQQPQRQGRTQTWPGQALRQVLAQALRIEMAVKRTLFVTHAHALDGLQRALDLPTQALRWHSGAAQVQIHRLALGLSDGEPAVALAASFVVHQADAPQGPLVLWSPLSRLKRFASLDQLRQAFSVDMATEAGRAPWLNMLAAPDRQRLRQAWEQTPSLAPLLTVTPLTGDLTEHLLHSRQGWIEGNVQMAWQLAVDSAFDAELFNASVAHSLIAGAIDMDLGALVGAIDTLELLKRLPLWARNASVGQLQEYTDRLRYCTEAANSRHNYLFAIPDLNAYTATQLKNAMQVKGLNVPEPDQVRVTLREYVTDLPNPGSLPNMIPAAVKTRTLTLVECALRHFDIKESIQEQTHLANGQPAPAWLTGSYVTRLIHQQDVGALYQRTLATLFNPNDHDYSLRQTWFIRGLRVQLLEMTFRYFLQKRLDTTALHYVLSMIQSAQAPSCQTVLGTPICLRPVRLVAEPDMKPDTLTGVYLIGPQDVSQGPVVLYAPYANELTLKQYPHQAAFLTDTQTNPALAALIVSRVADDARTLYANGGLTEPHVPFNTESSFDAQLPPAPPRLDPRPASGPAPVFLFKDNLALLQLMARRQTVTNAQADWQAFTYIASLGLEQGQMFLPGEMALLLGAWQSQALLNAGVQAARQQRWGEAISQFVSAFANLVQHRREESSAIPTQVTRPAVQELAEQNPEPVFKAFVSGWRQPSLPSELRTRLFALQTQDVELRDLLKDPLTQLYSAEGNPNQYAVVMGRAFQVEQYQGAVYIVSDGERGPRLTLNAQQDWQVELPNGLRGGGAALNRMKVDRSLNTFFTVTAEGMPAIRALNFGRAEEIVTAHRQAADYMRVCLQNLNTTRPEMPLPARSLQTIRDFLGVSTVTPQVLMKIRQRARDLFTYLLQPAMNPLTSSNYVMGRTHNPNSAITAFVYTTELRDRVYLTERFFNVPADYFRHVAMTPQGFDITAHYQGATLLHELSHLFSDTTDIAYVEACSPYLDLYDDNPAAQHFRDLVQTAQQRSLSRLTPREELFKQETAEGWVDIKSRAKARVLEITETDSLDDARNEFYLSTEKRVEVMINNADTVTLLMTLLGRTLHPRP